MVFRMLALLGALVGLASSAQAQDVSSADRAAIRDIIQSQVDAFRREGAVAQGLGTVIRPARECQAQIAHGVSLIAVRRAVETRE